MVGISEAEAKSSIIIDLKEGLPNSGGHSTEIFPESWVAEISKFLAASCYFCSDCSVSSLEQEAQTHF